MSKMFWLGSVLLLVASISPAVAYTALPGAPVWTQILTTTGSSSEASGQFLKYDGGTVTSVANTDTAVYSTLTLPSTSGTYASTGGTDVAPCNSTSSYPSYFNSSYVPPYRYPGELIRSNYGPSGGSFKGLIYYGSFNVTGGLIFGSGSDLVLTSFFHETPCYGGGREYGVYYNASDYSLNFYASTYTNCNPTICSGNSASVDTWEVPTGNSWTDGNYFFEIWPVAVGSGCGFNLQIQGPPPSYTVYWNSAASSNIPTNSSAADSGFCSAIQNESGYTTTGIQYIPTISNISTTAPYYSMGIQGIYIGK